MSIGVVGCDDNGPPPWVGGRTRGDMLADGESGGVAAGDLISPTPIVVSTGAREKTLLPRLLPAAAIIVSVYAM